MDKLQVCARSFEKLIDKKYHIVIGKRQRLVDIELIFEATDFHHLMGLHKLKDLRLSKGNRETIFRDVLAGHIHFSDIEKSSFFSRIEKRIEPLADLEKILDDNRLVFKYNEKAHAFSLIKAEYLLSTLYKTNDIYIFLDRKGQDKQFFCRSFFPKENMDYTIGQPVYTLLFKEKITISTGEREVQYDRLSPAQKHNILSENTTPPLSKPPLAAPEEPAGQSMKERMAAAQAEADRRNTAGSDDRPPMAKQLSEERQ